MKAIKWKGRKLYSLIDKIQLFSRDGVNPPTPRDYRIHSLRLRKLYVGEPHVQFGGRVRGSNPSSYARRLS